MASEALTPDEIDSYWANGYAFVENALNWTTSGATLIQNVSLIAPHIARVVTNVQIGAAETLDIVALPDLAGNNAAGLISVDPLE